MKKSDFKLELIGKKVINIETMEVGKLSLLNLNLAYRNIKEILCVEIEGDSLELTYDLTDWYTKDQLEDMRFGGMQALNLLQSNFFKEGEGFYPYSPKVRTASPNLGYVAKDRQGILLNFAKKGEWIFLDDNRYNVFRFSRNVRKESGIFPIHEHNNTYDYDNEDTNIIKISSKDAEACYNPIKRYDAMFEKEDDYIYITNSLEFRYISKKGVTTLGGYKIANCIGDIYTFGCEENTSTRYLKSRNNLHEYDIKYMIRRNDFTCLRIKLNYDDYKLREYIGYLIKKL